MKALAPLLAETLLIVVAVSLGAVFFIFFNSFTKTTVQNIPPSACVGALDIVSAKGSNTTLTITLKNNEPYYNLTGISLVVGYSNITKNKNYKNILEKLNANAEYTYILNTNDTEKPLSVEAAASSCPEFHYKLNIR